MAQVVAMLGGRGLAQQIAKEAGAKGAIDRELVPA